MAVSKHISPISFEAVPSATESRENWEVVLTYEGENDISGLTNLSHWPKWDIQDKSLSRIELSDIHIPDQPGSVFIGDTCIVNRVNATQATIWQYREQVQQWPVLPAMTDVTDAYALVALYGRETARIMEKVTTLDLAQPGKDSPFLLQGPVLHIPMQVVVMKNDRALLGVLMAFARGYGQTVVDALLDAGEDFGLKPAGEKTCIAWFESDSP